MIVINYSDPITGRWFREFKRDSYKALSELKMMYEKEGRRTWMSHWLGDVWVLTVAL